MSETVPLLQDSCLPGFLFSDNQQHQYQLKLIAQAIGRNEIQRKTFAFSTCNRGTVDRFSSCYCYTPIVQPVAVLHVKIERFPYYEF